MQPVMQPGMPMGVSNMGGGQMPADNTNAMGGNNEAGCYRGSLRWPQCHIGY
ncbi:hypothetical protein PC116_g25417 [Phytophthora cactorum]|nr:hypothetical protein PC114_g23486 [Phytophthora cactorum]KAG2885664.1 hypothetical protein PC115_g20933 [Phytophthora cactorum]KAG2895091.1 hypothetical protein PC117_g23322 [Phytophthora cactorum]KAG2972793.1 hypothetical protein PC119_g23059 [Phytophthora cactorum]KAG3130264.1 hypothetical protein C6341_g23812 [Phytophthora cactorum]